MIKKIKALLTSLTVSGMIFLPIAAIGLVPATAHAANSSVTQLCGGANLNVSVAGSAATNCVDTSPAINHIVTFILNLFSIIVGIAAVIMIVVGGFKYTISGGDSTRVSGAKDTILFAIVGLVVVALAQIIVHFVLHNVQHSVGVGGGS